jgi:Ni/Co efflux regulator RcnB
MEENMRKIAFTLAALAAFGLSMPLAAPAKAEEGKVVIKTGDRDRDHDRRWHRDRHHHKVVIIKKHRDRDHD